MNAAIALPASLLFTAALRARPARAQQETTPPNTFTWGSSSDTSKSWKPCASVLITNYPKQPTPNPAPEPPYYLVTYPENGVPQIISAGQTGTFNWTANYPSGTTVLLGMVDANGNSGGIGDEYTVTGTAGTCAGPPTGLGNMTTSVAAGSQAAQCSDIEVSWSGGTAPYTLTVARIGSIPFNVTGITKSPYNWTNTIQNGGQAMLVLSDATDQYFATTEVFTSGISDDSSCLSGGSTSTGSGGSSGSSSGSSGSGGSSDGKYIGAGVGGGVVVLGLVGLATWFFFRKRNRANAQHAGYPPEKPGMAAYGGGGSNRTSGPPGSDEEHRHLAASHSGYGTGTTPSSTADSFNYGGQQGRDGDIAYVPPHSAGYSSYGGSNQSPRSTGFPQSNRASVASSGGHGGYPPMPPMPLPNPHVAQPTGFRIANPDQDHAGPSAGPSSGARRASLGPGSRLNQDYTSKNPQQIPDLPGAKNYFQAKDFEDDAPNFDQELPPAYRDRRA